MPSIQQFAHESESAVLTVRAIDIAVTYNPDRITVRDVAELSRAEEEMDFEVLADFLNKMVDAWDVTGPLYGEPEERGGEPVELVGEGEVIPFTHECIEALGLGFTMEFFSALQAEAIQGPNPTAVTAPSPKRSRGRGRTRTTTR